MARHKQANAFHKGYGLTPAKAKPAFTPKPRGERYYTDRHGLWYTAGDGRHQRTSWAIISPWDMSLVLSSVAP